MNKNKDLQDPHLLFDNRIRQIKQRIQVLRNDYQKVNHYFSKAIIETELEKLEDELIERSFILQRTSKAEEGEETKN